MRIFKDSQTVIKEIHNAFDSAQDRLLKDAENILSTVKPNEKSEIEDKAERLERLGFTSSLAVKEASGIREQRKEKETLIVKSRGEAELISYYKHTYPFLKFLTEVELDKICNKYNLIYAPVGNYKEDVPLKNLREIENSQELKSLDKCGTKYIVKVKSSNIKPSKVSPEIEDKLINGFEATHDMIFAFGNYPEWSVSTIINKAFNIEVDFIRYTTMDWGYSEINKSGLFICAPKSHFDLKGLKKNKLGYFFTTITEVKDPIVFRYVRGGVQVLSKWGLEASDEALINPINN